VPRSRADQAGEGSAARCLQSIGEDRPGPAHHVDEHRRARSPPAQESSVDITSVPART